ncbi:MAG: polysaccharide deacetylase family protein [Candidatus Levybacteria bacterium]|nr:polysaccharide deacetylase family protein [Candidatus Levybacteria bacterium]
MANKPEKSPKRTSHPSFLLFLFFLTLLLSFFATYLYRTFSSIQEHNRKELQLEMKKIPKDIKKKLTKTKSSIKRRIPILIYHYVEIVTDKNDTIRQSMNIQPAILEKQITTLQDAGYTFITPSNIGKMLNGKKEIPKKAVILSFDDGYRDFYTDVLPILKRKQAKAIAYIVPGKLNQINYLFSWQLHEIYGSGLVEIGAHTVHHMNLKGISYMTAKYEIEESKTMLENMLYIPILSFAYPYGAFDSQAILLVKEAGFTTAVSSISGNDVSESNRYLLYRIHPGYRTGKELISALEKEYKP